MSPARSTARETGASFSRDIHFAKGRAATSVDREYPLIEAFG
jgi:hypothetical protein